MKRLKISTKLLIAGFSLVILLTAGGGIYLYLPRLVAEVKNPLAGRFNPGILKIEKPDFTNPSFRDAFTFRIRVNDSIHLSAYSVPAKGRARGTIVALHGYRSNKNRFLPAAKYFSHHQWNFIAIDLRGHNGSDGSYTGFSYFERHDLDTFLDSLKVRGLVRRPLVLYGHSTGAATAVFTAAHRNDIDALVLESCFDDFRKLIPNYLDYYLGVNWFASGSLPRHLFERLHIPLDSLKPWDVAPEINIPVLQIQGDADQKVKPVQAWLLFKRLASPQKQWITVRGGTHNRLWLPDTMTYFERINAFLIRVLPMHPMPDGAPE